jgi:DNA-binding MarR family transcriptional regulator
MRRRDLSPRERLLENELFGAIFLLGQHLNRRGDAALLPLDLTSKQWLLLAVLTKAFAGRAPTLSEVAAVHGSSRQNVKQLAQQLAARGFLRLVPDAKDGRMLRLELTPKVVALFESPEALGRQEALFEEVFRAFDAEDLRRLHGLVTRWLAATSPP